MEKYIVPSSEYRKQVMIAKRVNHLADDIHDKDQKRKFLMRGYPPSLESLEEHQVKNHLKKFFPYLLYYHEPDIRPSMILTEDWAEVSVYIDNLFKTDIVVSEEPRETPPYQIDTDLYDKIIDDNLSYCLEYAKNLTDYELAVFHSRHDVTLERFLSLDVKRNVERFLPFLLRVTEPSVLGDTPFIEGKDGGLIKNYIRNTLYETIDFCD